MVLEEGLEEFQQLSKEDIAHWCLADSWTLVEAVCLVCGGSMVQTLAPAFFCLNCLWCDWIAYGRPQSLKIPRACYLPRGNLIDPGHPSQTKLLKFLFGFTD